MNVRKVSIKDYKKIQLLFIRNNLKILSFKRWKDLWSKNPFFKNKKKDWIKGWVLEYKSNIVGHFGSFPTYYNLNEKLYKCSVLYGWVVDRKFRSFSILLLKKIYNQLNVDFFLGSTTNIKAGRIMESLKSKKIPLNQLNYTSFIVLDLKKTLEFFFKKKKFKINKMFLNLFQYIISILFKKKLNFWSTKFDESNIFKCKKIDNKFNLIWKKIKRKHKNLLLLQRDKLNLNWRLNYFLKENKAWIFFSYNKKKINGYAICVENQSSRNSLKKAFLIDLIPLEEDKNISINLIGASIKEAKKRNCDIFEFKIFDKAQKPVISFFNPFERKLLNNPFYYKSNNKKLGKMLNKEKYWIPAYIDGDSIVNF